MWLLNFQRTNYGYISKYFQAILYERMTHMTPDRKKAKFISQIKHAIHIKSGDLIVSKTGWLNITYHFLMLPNTREPASWLFQTLMGLPTLHTSWSERLEMQTRCSEGTYWTKEREKKMIDSLGIIQWEDSILAILQWKDWDERIKIKLNVVVSVIKQGP